MKTTKPQHTWKVVPLSPNQLTDIRSEDILDNGLYRQCHSYRGGGGYDQFPFKASNLFGGSPNDYCNQFIVQLQGCNLDCPYCYVTRAGVWGKATRITTTDLVYAFIKSKQQVFHLMGGAPALQLKHWPELITCLFEKAPKATFHSDLMLTERSYDKSLLKDISQPRCLYAINIKGLNPKDWFKNTRKRLDENLFWANWRAVQKACVPAYITFTGCPEVRIEDFWEKALSNGIDVKLWKQNSFLIHLINYDAIEFVDSVAWGNSSLNIT